MCEPFLHRKGVWPTLSFCFQLLNRRSEFLALGSNDFNHVGDDEEDLLRSPTLPPDEKKMLETLREIIRSGVEANKIRKI